MCVGATVCVIHVEARGQLPTLVSLFLFLETNLPGTQNSIIKGKLAGPGVPVTYLSLPVPGLQAHVTRPGLFSWVLRTRFSLGWQALGKPSYLPSRSWLFLTKMEGFSGLYLEG